MRTRSLALLLAIAACARGGKDARSTDSAAGDVAHDPPTRVARLSLVVGSVSRQAPGADTWTHPVPNSTLSTGDRLYTSRDARAELDFGGAAVRLGHDGALTVTNVSDNVTRLGLNEGALEASLFRHDGSDSLELDTPNGALVPTDAAAFIVSIEPPGGGTVVSVESGHLQLAGPGLHESLKPGEVVRLVGTGPTQAVPVGTTYTNTVPVFGDLERWRSTRDPLFTSLGRSSRYVSAHIPGREDLDDNGVWVTDAADAHVWCPTSVSATWVPYRAGRWSWVEPWGWTWVGDEPWAYAPFHYGRWETVASRECTSSWAWVPGPVGSQPVWSPALVAFVSGAALDLKQGPDVEAWFPLGPKEPFFPWYHHSDGYLHDVNATNLIQVRNVDSLVHDDDIRDIRRINRDNALTIVSSAVISMGAPVALHAFDAARTDLLPPLLIAPHPAVNPRPELLAGGDPAPTPRFERAGAVASNDAPGGSATARLSSTARQAAMRAHPGRPLEPRQIDNIRAGRPAGPARDREIPGHRVVAPELED